MTVLRAGEHALNGMVFLLLGLRLPVIAGFAPQVITWSSLGCTVLATSFGLFALRWLWVWVTLRITVYRHRTPGKPVGRVSLRLVTATAFAGVRGAVSLAAAVLLPMTVMTEHGPYRAQEVAVSIAAGVIVLSLVSASIGLPLAVRGVDLPEPDHGEQRGALRAELAEAAITAVERARDEKGESADTAATIVLEPYRARTTGELTADRYEHELLERELRLVALHAERELLHRKWRRRAVDDGLYRELMHEIDTNEEALTGVASAARRHA